MAWKEGDPRPNRDSYKPGAEGQKEFDADDGAYQTWNNKRFADAKTRPAEGKFQKNARGTGVEYVPPPAAAPVIVDTGTGAGDAAKKADADRKAADKAAAEKADADRKAADKAAAEKAAMASPGQTGAPRREQFEDGLVGQSKFNAATKKYQEKLAAQKSTAIENQKKNR